MFLPVDFVYSIVMKKTKSGEKESDIRPHIFSLTLESEKDGIATYKMWVSCSNEYNLKPETVIDAMEKGDFYATQGPEIKELYFQK